jgi:hypothetical protein
LIVSMLAAAGTAAAAVPLINGGFEGTVAPWVGSGGGQRYDLAGNGVAALTADNLAPFYSAPGPGVPTSQAAVAQAVVGFVPGGLYQISFEAAHVFTYRFGETSELLPSLSPGGVEVLLDGVPTAWAADVPGVVLVDPSDDLLTYGGIDDSLQRYSLVFTATKESHVLGLRAVERPPGVSGPADIPRSLLLVDNVELVAIPETGVPVLLTAAAGFLLARRRRGERGEAA